MELWVQLVLVIQLILATKAQAVTLMLILQEQTSSKLVPQQFSLEIKISNFLISAPEFS